MPSALSQALTLIESDHELRQRLVDDPKGTVLYVLPKRMGDAHQQFSVDHELELVAMAELFHNDADGLLGAIRQLAEPSP